MRFSVYFQAKKSVLIQKILAAFVLSGNVVMIKKRDLKKKGRINNYLHSKEVEK